MVTTTVLVLGATGRTGRLVVEQLVQNGDHVKAVVRSAKKIPAWIRNHNGIQVVEGQLLNLSLDEIREIVSGCDAAVSCLGHVISWKGIFGPPRDLVSQSVQKVCRAIQANSPPVPVKFALMGSVSVNFSPETDSIRSGIEKWFLAALQALVPPVRDNQSAADFLLHEIGVSDPILEWVVVRPDTLQNGEISEYTVQDKLIHTLWKPGHTRRANVADFMCNLLSDQNLWNRWRGKMPTILNAK